jgi:hydroxymethylglutaryl-CoA synthase
MKVGIEKLDLYAGRFSLNAVELAVARGKEAAYARDQILVDTRSVLPPYEDAVTLAVNAGQRLLADEDRSSIALLIVGTESGLDFGKPLSTWVHRHLGLPENCRNFEVKHACYGPTAAFKTAAAYVLTMLPPGKKALVIGTDFTRPGLRDNDGLDFIGGACAVAFLVSNQPKVLEIDPLRCGYWTHEIADTFRPTATMEVMRDERSVYSYLDALEGAYGHYEQVNGKVELDTHFKHHIYHAPFPGMTLQAHRTLLGLKGMSGKALVKASFEAKVRQGLRFARRIGTAYGASNFVSLLGLLSTPEVDLTEGQRVSIFSYGSGCQGEFYEASIGAEAMARVRERAVDAHLDERMELTLPEYEHLEDERARMTERQDFVPERTGLRGAYERQYAGRKLLVLERVQGHERTYGWS